LLIKLERIKDEEKFKNVKHELSILRPLCEDITSKNTEALILAQLLYGVNTALWDVEDRLREYERNKNFGEKFIEDARSVYMFNDKRAQIKKDINIITNSDIVEEKSYASY
jgi:hypothetical protein